MHDHILRPSGICYLYFNRYLDILLKQQRINSGCFVVNILLAITGSQQQWWLAHYILKCKIVYNKECK